MTGADDMEYAGTKTGRMPPPKPNKGLHDLYVWWAMEHLVIMRKAIKKLYRASFNWHAPRFALVQARNHLVRTDPAYQEAAWRLLCGEAVVYQGDIAIGTYDPAVELLCNALDRCSNKVKPDGE